MARKTVNVSCGVTNGIVMQLHSLPDRSASNRLPDARLGDRITLKHGDNPGIDAEFFEFWMEENKNLSVAGLISATAEEDKEDAAASEVRDDTETKS